VRGERVAVNQPPNASSKLSLLFAKSMSKSTRPN
jgi:hypothetical protein